MACSPPRSLSPLAALLPAGLALALAAPTPASAHGAAGGEDLAPGTFRISPVITLEGHAGLENNLEGQPRHYAIDGLVGVVMEWGLPNQGSFAIEAMLGPALVWGEAEHFYGRVHVDEAPGHGGGHSDDHGDDHAEEEHGDEHAEEHGDEHAEETAHGHDDHDDHAEDHGHGNGHAHGHGHGGAPFRRTDIKGQLQVRYAPNQRLSFFAEWLPYYVTRDQGEDMEGLKNELGFGLAFAFGDGDVNFALGDGLETIADGVFVSLENRTGWESDGTYIGNYTDPWLGFGFNVDRLNVTLSGGPRFYSPGSYSGLPGRTDWGGEVELELPVSPRTVLFAHWKPIYSTQGGEGWGRGWQHHIGTGVTFRF
ncbi:MAG: hypothetical protein ACK55E_03280 [Cyanobacteriota bacterium]